MWVSKKRFEELEERHNRLRERFNNFASDLNTNGVATAINKLNDEVFRDKTKDTVYGMALFSDSGTLVETPTLRGRVEAICEFLGLELGVTEPTKSKVVAKKVKVSKKKGRK